MTFIKYINFEYIFFFSFTNIVLYTFYDIDDYIHEMKCLTLLFMLLT